MLGKVTRVLSGNDSINLTRRTGFAAIDQAKVTEVLGGIVTAVPGLSSESARTQVKAPAVQILPLAVFI